jgi:2-haloacid dehalogenase
MASYQNIIFDLGGVLIDWNPRYLYRKIFRTEHAVNHFLDNITTSDWNEEQDAGRPLTVATQLLTDQYPEYTPEIEAFYGRWEEEMLGGPVEGTVDVLRSFIEHPDYKVLALTNWSAETFPFALSKFDFLHWFEGILVSGEEKIKKPDPGIYQLMLERYNLDPLSTVFIDDNLRNIQAAEKAGIKGIHFINPGQLKSSLIQLGIDLDR